MVEELPDLRRIPAFHRRSRRSGRISKVGDVTRHEPPTNCVMERTPNDGVLVANSARGKSALVVEATARLEQAIHRIQRRRGKRLERDRADVRHDVVDDLFSIRRPRRAPYSRADGRQPLIDEEIRHVDARRCDVGAGSESAERLRQCALRFTPGIETTRPSLLSTTIDSGELGDVDPLRSALPDMALRHPSSSCVGVPPRAKPRFVFGMRSRSRASPIQCDAVVRAVIQCSATATRGKSPALNALL